MAWGNKREPRKPGASPSPSPHLQPSVDHAVGADIHADGLAVLQLQGVLGVESEEVYQLRSGIDFRLDDGFTLPGEFVSNGHLALRGGWPAGTAAAVSRSGAARRIRTRSAGCFPPADHVLASERCGLPQAPAPPRLLCTQHRPRDITATPAAPLPTLQCLPTESQGCQGGLQGETLIIAAHHISSSSSRDA